MSKLPGIIILACALLLSQSNAIAQKKAEPKEKKKAPTEEVMKGKEKKTDGKAVKKAASKAESGAKKVTPLSSEDPVVGKTQDGRPVHEGARGGFYYVTEGGNKTYVKDFVGAKIVGKTADGLPIYEGPRGGRFYYSNSGEKVYVKKQ